MRKNTERRFERITSPRDPLAELRRAVDMFRQRENRAFARHAARIAEKRKVADEGLPANDIGRKGKARKARGGSSRIETKSRKTFRKKAANTNEDHDTPLAVTVDGFDDTRLNRAVTGIDAKRIGDDMGRIMAMRGFKDAAELLAYMHTEHGLNSIESPSTRGIILSRILPIAQEKKRSLRALLKEGGALRS